MHATEKKDDYGQFSCSFNVQVNDNIDGNVFIVIQKQQKNQPDKYMPIFKSECKKLTKGTITWNTVNTDTDTLADSDGDKTLLVQFFKFNSNGNHKKVDTGEIKYNQFTSGR